MKILVTGGAGFIGSHVVDKYIQLGYNIIIIDNLCTGTRENLNKKAKFYNIDILDFEKLNEVFEKEKPDIINHHAAHVSVRESVENPQFDTQTNIIGTINLLELAIKHKVKKFIFIGSGGAQYGEPKYLPIKESHETNPMSSYAISKHTVEHYLQLYQKLYNLPYVSLRYGNIYGPRQDPYGEAGVIAIFINQLLNNKRPTIFGDGTQIRDYSYVKDVVSANVLVTEKKEAENQAFNVGTGKQTSTQEIFDLLKKLTNSNLKPIYEKERPGDLKASCLDSTKLQKLGWKINYDLEQGLKETLAYFKNKK